MINTEEFTGEDLKALRKKHKLTQMELAEAMGTHQVRISEWENGRQQMSKMTRIAFKHFFERF